MARYEDLEDDVEVSSNPGVIARMATVVVLIFLGVAVYFYLDSGKDSKDPSSLPLITENHPPTIVKPENPGGMNIPDQDASVYQHLNKNATPEAEKLMPTAEVPVDTATQPPTTPASLPDALPSLPGAQQADKTPPPAVAAAEPEPLPEPAPAQNDTSDLQKIVQQVAAPEDSRIQLGAVSSQGAAQSEWARIQAKYSDELGGLNSHFSEVNLGAKGDFVRIQTDTMTEADATARCGKLKLAGQACMVIKAAQ